MFIYTSKKTCHIKIVIKIARVDGALRKFLVFIILTDPLTVSVYRFGEYSHCVVGAVGKISYFFKITRSLIRSQDLSRFEDYLCSEYIIWECAMDL